MLEAEHLSFSYGKKIILNDLSFRAEDGECVVVVGENGCGKSTLLSVLSGALKAKSGSVRSNGPIGLVPQGNSVFDDMTVAQNIRFFAGLAGKKSVSRLPFDLEEYADVKAGRLSGGYKKRLNVACTLVTAPKVWLFDEPCANLDTLWRSEMIRLVQSCKERGCTVIYVSHDREEYTGFADKTLHLENSQAGYA